MREDYAWLLQSSVEGLLLSDQTALLWGWFASKTDIQQGDPIGPDLFYFNGWWSWMICDEAAWGVQSEFIVRY